MRAPILAAVLMLAACAPNPPPEPVIKTQIVDVPVTRHCDPQIKPVTWTDAAGVVHEGYPDTPEAIAAAPDLFSRVKLLLSGRVLRIQHEAELLAAVNACK